MPYKDRERRLAYLKDWRKRHNELKGICRRCYSKVFPGFKVCSKHLYESQLKWKRYYQKHGDTVRAKVIERSNRLQKEGKCRNCGIKLIEGEGILCVNCGGVGNGNYIIGVLR